MKRSLAFAMAAVVLLAAGALQAQPAQPVKVIVPFSAGGGTDNITRIVTDALGRELDQSVIVENRAGGNTVIGALATTSAKPDGSTLLSTLDMTTTILPAVYSKLPFDPQKDLTPVAIVAKVPSLFVANPKLPANTLKELVEYSKKNPDRLNYGSATLYGQVQGQQLKTVSGLSYQYVPFKGAPEAIQAVLGGHVDFIMVDIASAMGYLKDGRLKALTMLSAKRHPQLPDVSTVVEQGWPELEMNLWIGLFAPSQTPAPVVDHLNKAVNKVVSTASVQEKLRALGHEAEPASVERIRQMISADTAKWSKAARDGNIRLD